jgi:hypothetical protein
MVTPDQTKWVGAMSLSSMLRSIQLLLATPNPDSPQVTSDITWVLEELIYLEEYTSTA